MKIFAQKRFLFILLILVAVIIVLLLITTLIRRPRDIADTSNYIVTYIPDTDKYEVMVKQLKSEELEEQIKNELLKMNIDSNKLVFNYSGILQGRDSEIVEESEKFYQDNDIDAANKEYEQKLLDFYSGKGHQE